MRSVVTSFASCKLQVASLPNTAVSMRLNHACKGMNHYVNSNEKVLIRINTSIKVSILLQQRFQIATLFGQLPEPAVNRGAREACRSTVAITPIDEGENANRHRRLACAVLRLSEILRNGGYHGRRKDALTTIVTERVEVGDERMATFHPCFQRAPSMARGDIGAVELCQMGAAHGGVRT